MEGNILVCTDTCGFECFRAQLLIFVRNHMNTKRELIDIRTFAAEIEDADLGVGDTTVEARLGIWL